MTNLDKAREIAKNNACIYTESHYEFGELQDFEFDSSKECEKSALQMAEWKDAQFKEYLEKKKEQFYYQPKDLMGGWEKKHKLEMLEEIINELFPESKELDNSNNDD